MLSRGITKSRKYLLNKSTILRNELDLKNCNTKENEFNTFDFVWFLMVTLCKCVKDVNYKYLFYYTLLNIKINPGI